MNSCLGRSVMIGLLMVAVSVPLNAQKVSVQRELPPAVNLENTRINLEILSLDRVTAQHLGILKTRLTTALQSDKRFIVDPAGANALVRLTITDVALSRGTVTTTKQVNMTRVQGNVQVSFQVIDTVSKQPLDSANLQAVFDRAYAQQAQRRGGILGVATSVLSASTAPPPDEGVMDAMINDLVASLTRRMARTKDVVEFGELDGSLKQHQNKARARQWVALYDDLDVMPVPRDQAVQAERLYWMGAAKEALAYETPNRDDARKSLLAAVRHYQEASKIDTEKAEFGAASRRAEESIVLLAGATPDEKVASVTPGSRTATTAAADALTNDHVIQMVKNQMEESLLIDIIAVAPSTKFDLSPNGLVALSREKVPTGVIQAMRKRSQ